MKTIRLDGRAMTDRNAAHAHIKKQMGFPDYYGANLDALWDLLTEPRHPVTVILGHAGAARTALGDYGGALIGTFEEAAAENEDLFFTIKD